MHIFVNNKTLSIHTYKVKCAIGKRGIGIKKKEGDKITPKGNFKIKCIYFRQDRVTKLKSGIKSKPIKKNMGWCDDPKSIKYNSLIKFPFKFSAERLYRADNIYDIILVLDYNINPVKKNKGSAIFIHVAKKNFSKTNGCIAINKKKLIKIVQILNKKSLVKII